MGKLELEQKAITDTLQCFFDGFDNRDGSLVKQAFHPQAFTFNTSKEASQGIPINMFCDSFLPFVKQHPEHPWNKEVCEKEVLMIDITEDVAIAKVEWRYSFLTMTDYYTLILIDGKWLITSKVWHDKELS